MNHHFQEHHFGNDKVTYISPGWDEINLLTYEVSCQVRAQTQRFDRIVTLAKGGWPMTRSLIDFTQIPEIASIGIKFYAGINQKLDKPLVYQDIPVSVEGERILLFDDVADSGESLIFTTNLLKKRGAKQVSTATIFYKPHSSLKPDFFGAQTSAWIVFPFEPFEMIELIGGKWIDQGLSQEELAKRFNQFGFGAEITQKAIQELYQHHHSNY